MKKNKQYIIAFFIPFIIFILVFANANIIFGGSKNFLISDARAQYIALFGYLKDVLSGTESLFYSFAKGLGGNMIGTFAYYLASPLNFLVYFFQKHSLDNAILLILILKVGFAGLTMFSYLKNKYNKGKTLYIFSSSYALMGYIVVYYFNIMWLDAIYFIPLIMLGIDKIIEGKKSWLYGISLCLAIFSNYYIGYMLCIWSVLYFFYQLFLHFNMKRDKEKVISIITKFGITSILAGCMTSILLLPSLYEMFINTSRVGDMELSNTIFKGNFFDHFARFYIGAHSKNNMLNQGTAALYTGLIILPLVYFYFVNKEIKTKERLLSGIVLLILISGLFIEPIDYVWHGFSKMYSFDYRYSFIISMFLIILACRSFYKIKSIDLKHYLLFLSIFLIISNIIIINKYIFLNIWSVYLSVVIMIIYLMLLRLYHFASNKEKKLLSTLLIFLVFAELFFNFYFSIYKHEFESKDEYDVSYVTIVDKINNIKPINNDFYRIEKDIKYSYNDSFWMDYEGVSVFLSTLNKNVKKIMTNTGHTTLTSSVHYNIGSSPIMDSLLGIKYFISDDKIPSYKLIDEFQFSKFSGLLFNEYMDDFYVLENPNSLSLGFMVNDKVKDFINIFKDGKITNVFEVQNYMLKTMVDQDVNYLKPYSFTKINDSEFEVEINNTKDIYIVVPVLIDNPKIKVHMFINDELVWTYNSRYTGVFKILNTYENSTINFKIKVSNATGNFSFVPSFYYLEEEEFLKAVEELKKNQMEIIKKDKNYLKGKIEVNEDKTVLFTSIPYEKGWEILVDGKKVEYFPIFDSFIGLDLDGGVHEIEFKFVSPLFKLGLIISIISALLFIFYIRFEEKIIKNITKLYFKYEEIISYLIVGGFITIVSIGSYAVFSRLFGLNYIISNILSFVVAVIVAFFTNKIFVFKTAFENIRKTIWEMYQFIKYRIITLGIDVILMIAFVEWLHINDLIAKIVVQIVVVIMNYFFSKLIVFKKVNN